MHCPLGLRTVNLYKYFHQLVNTTIIMLESGTLTRTGSQSVYFAAMMRPPYPAKVTVIVRRAVPHQTALETYISSISERKLTIQKKSPRFFFLYKSSLISQISSKSKVEHDETLNVCTLIPYTSIVTLLSSRLLYGYQYHRCPPPFFPKDIFFCSCFRTGKHEPFPTRSNVDYSYFFALSNVWRDWWRWTIAWLRYANLRAPGRLPISSGRNECLTVGSRVKLQDNVHECVNQVLYPKMVRWSTSLCLVSRFPNLQRGF